MIKVAFNKPNPPHDFDDWVKRGKAAAKKLTCGSEVKGALYKEQRKAMLALFNGKCAYCEARLGLNQHSGDVEHFRPKGGVTDENDKPVTIASANGKGRAHPGYYWLAYEPLNLLPSCIGCNRPAKVGDQRVGKWNRFPVDGEHAVTAKELAKEKPLLLNPLLAADDPAKHLKFDHTTGRIVPKTKRGEVTIRVLNLNREGLPEERRNVYDNVLARALETIVQRDAGSREKAMVVVRDHKGGRAGYAMAGRAAIAEHLALIQDNAKLIEG